MSHWLAQEISWKLLFDNLFCDSCCCIRVNDMERMHEHRACFLVLLMWTVEGNVKVECNKFFKEDSIFVAPILRDNVSGSTEPSYGIYGIVLRDFLRDFMGLTWPCCRIYWILLRNLRNHVTGFYGIYGIMLRDLRDHSTGSCYGILLRDLRNHFTWKFININYLIT